MKQLSFLTHTKLFSLADISGPDVTGEPTQNDLFTIAIYNKSKAAQMLLFRG